MPVRSIKPDKGNQFSLSYKSRIVSANSFQLWTQIRLTSRIDESRQINSAFFAVENQCQHRGQWLAQSLQKARDLRVKCRRCNTDIRGNTVEEKMLHAFRRLYAVVIPRQKCKNAWEAMFCTGLRKTCTWKMLRKTKTCRPKEEGVTADCLVRT